MKKLLSVLLATLMLLTMIPLGVVSASSATSGITGDCTWTLDDNGQLTVFGNGAMGDYYVGENEPWRHVKSVIIEEGVTAIGNRAFYNCSELVSITIPNTVESIGVEVFIYCDSLDSIVIPSSVTSIGFDAFGYCMNLMSIDVDEGNADYSSVDGVLFNKQKTLLIRCPGGKNGVYVIPDTVKEIAGSAFQYCHLLASIAIPNGVEEINDCTFSGCKNLIDISIPVGVSRIGYSAFRYSNRLVSVSIPNSITYIGSSAFDGCISLTDVYYDGSVSDKNNIVIHGSINNPILIAKWHYAEGEPVSITKEPTTGYAKMGEKVSVKVTAEGEGLRYEWYIKNDGAKKYSKSSVTSAIYSTTMSDKAKGRRVYCVITDLYGNKVQSKTVLLREAASITKQPATVAYAKKGAKASVKITAKGDGLKYAWYIKNEGGSKYSKSSVTSATYSTTMSSKVKGRRIYCIVTDKYGKTVQSKTFLLRESVSITTQPKTVTVAKNKTAKVTVKASGDGLKYTWYIKNAGSSKYSKSSVKTASYSAKMTSKVKNRQVYCVVTDKYGKTVKTVTVKLKMK